MTIFLESANQTLEQVLRLDPVTKLGTKSLFKEYLNREWKRAIKEKKWLSLIRFDLDYFQEYQDLYSQLVADESLEKIGSVMKTIVKRSGDLTIHYGEGKFAILLPNTNVVDADCVAEEIREKIKELEIVNLQSKINTHLTASLGVAGIKPSLIEKQKALITRAEQALTQAKQSGRNRKAVWNNSYNEIHTVYEGINEIPTVLS
ncbi:MAG: diguanylate cyclase [Prochloraceae cyanobacterium]|nr:diguanylate cyclase [Prochloraceae cyanobacterium]